MTEAAPSSTTGQRINPPGSWAAASDRGSPWKTRSTARVTYAAVTTTVPSALTSSRAATQRATGVSWCPVPVSQSTSMIASLDSPPASGGTPTRASPPSRKTAYVTGSARRSPPSRLISTDPVACSTTPAQRNSPALNAAWVSRWNAPAARPPTASAASMYASWLTVDQASTRLRSSWPSAASAPSGMVTAATSPRTASVTGAASNAG